MSERGGYPAGDMTADELPPPPASLCAGPADPLTHALLQLRMIAEAKNRGASWNQIAATLGAPDGKAAKALAHKLARTAQRAVITRDLAAGGDDGR